VAGAGWQPQIGVPGTACTLLQEGHFTRLPVNFFSARRAFPQPGHDHFTFAAGEWEWGQFTQAIGAIDFVDQFVPLPGEGEDEVWGMGTSPEVIVTIGLME
jgi:hypothetical protein